MRCCISIGQIDKNIIFPIFGGLANFISIFIISKTDLSKHPIILSIGSTFGMSLSFILFIIYHCKNKSNNKKEINNENKIKLFEKKEEKKSNKYKFFLLTAFLDFIETILSNKYCKDIHISLWIFDILFICLFSSLIFKIKIYSHHFLSIIIIILTGIILDSIEGLYNNFLSRIIPIMIKFSLEIIMSFDIIITKYIMERFYCSSYEMCFYAGFFGFILYIILLIISKYTNFLDDFFIKYNLFGFKDYIIFSFFIITKLIYNLFMLITIKNTTSCHFLIILIFGELEPYIQNLLECNHKDIKTTITVIIGLFFILFMTLVFNEVFEFNCFGLEKNTKKNISKRVKIEENKLYNDEDDNESEISLEDFRINMENQQNLKKINENGENLIGKN